MYIDLLSHSAMLKMGVSVMPHGAVFGCIVEKSEMDIITVTLILVLSRLLFRVSK